MTLSELIVALGTDVHDKCYIASEAAQYILGAEDWKPCTIRHEGSVHWYLVHRKTGAILDLTVAQFKTVPSYSKGRGRGFLTKQPSYRTRQLLGIQ